MIPTRKVGIGKRCITPQQPIWMAGFAVRNHPHENVLHDVYIKTMALQDEGGLPAVLLTADLLGFDRATGDYLATQARQRFGLSRDRLILNTSHNHSGPVTKGLLDTYHGYDDAMDKRVTEYTEWMKEQALDAIGEALQTLAPATLSFGQGLAGFGTNRRRSRPGGRALPNVVDHDVPVLAVYDPDDSLRAVVFGYACHTTTLWGYDICGDYAGFAQVEMEAAHPDATALFVAGCGGDINPLPRQQLQLAQGYGHTLAHAVELVLQGGLTPVRGTLKTFYADVPLPLEPHPSLPELHARLMSYSENEIGLDDFYARVEQNLLDTLKREGEWPTAIQYPVQVWRFGSDLTFITLGGEPVADYALRFKDQYGCDNVWVSGYSNDVMAYVPSRRVRREGGYEGETGMPEYGWPSPFTEEVEELIAGQVEELMRQAAR